MSYTRQATRYRETEVLTATPGQLVVLLYDHLLLSLRRARTAMDARDVEAQSVCLEKGRDVLTELLVTLDRDRGGEVASNLAALYSFLLGELVQVGIAMVERYPRVPDLERSSGPDQQGELSNVRAASHQLGKHDPAGVDVGRFDEAEGAPRPHEMKLRRGRQLGNPPSLDIGMDG